MDDETSSVTSLSSEATLILNAAHPDPFGYLGIQPLEGGGQVVRVMRPDAEAVVLEKVDGSRHSLNRVDPGGLFELEFPEESERFSYGLALTFAGETFEPKADPFTFGPVLEDGDLYYFGEGTNRRLWLMLGAHTCVHEGIAGVRFAVWAPNARRVSVVGDFNNWDGRTLPMRNRGGVWEIFVPHLTVGAHYKFEILGEHGTVVKKSDPFAFFSQNNESTASLVCDLDQYQWSDSQWMERRAAEDKYHGPMSIYEVHLGSWKRRFEEEGRFLTYLEMAQELVDYVSSMGFTHVEMMPVAEFPFDGSWGYQVCGYFAPTSRFGSPDEFRALVDAFHQAGIGVIVDWVPAHFPKDEHGLGRFDGSALYEHADPRQGEHTDWGTYIFNYGRNEVRNFLVSNALFWLEEFHIDGLRVDAVASMLYLDYSREEGQWIPNAFGGRENLDAINFLKEFNSVCYEECPGIMTIAEESTAFPSVSRPLDAGGLGFGFKWNMGWMNDSLSYMANEPIHRKYHHGEATFSMIYAFHESYILVLSHDEVVHGKGSIVDKMPGDRWQQMANVRMFLAWMFAHPGKKLLFQGLEFGQSTEWDHSESLPWFLLDYPEHQGIQQLTGDLNRLYVSEPALHELDHEPEGFSWIDHDDAQHSLFSFVRRSQDGELVVTIINATPVPREGYRLGVPESGFYEEILNSDAETYGGSNLGSAGGIPSQDLDAHGQAQSIVINLPPLATVLFKRRVV
ncbi:MAG: 1,4-alpha-glucan branching protein GlgB [Verrucomicrobiota bacterium]